MNYEHLLLSTVDGITTLTLNRPDKRNALAMNVMLELTAALREVAQSEAVGVILAANGPVFSAGHNFGDMAGATLEQARELFNVCTAMMDAVQAMPQPVIARVHALATAAGCQLVATCTTDSCQCWHQRYFSASTAQCHDALQRRCSRDFDSYSTACFECASPTCCAFCDNALT